jgi:hypothetical protein
VKTKNRSLAAVDFAKGQILVWHGPWDPGVTYERYSVVFHNGSSYVATSAIAAGEDPTAAGDWQEFAAQGPPGAPGQDGTFSTSGYHEDAVCVNKLTGAMSSPPPHSGRAACDLTENAIVVVVKNH